MDKTKSCSCGCNTCSDNKSIIIKEQLTNSNIIVSEGLNYLINNDIDLLENIHRYGSKEYLKLIREARYLYSRDLIDVNPINEWILQETELGEFDYYEGKLVPLDLIFEEELPGGKADNLTLTQISKITSFDYNELKVNFIIGVLHELEHTSDLQIAQEIAKDHLIEDPLYYTKLKSIEESATAAAIAASAAAIAGSGLSSSSTEQSNPWALLALGVLFSIPAIGFIASESNFSKKIINWVKNYKLNKVIDRLRKDPEVLEFIKNKKPGLQKLLKSKLTDKELKYISRISWNKITKGNIQEILNLLEEKQPQLNKPKRSSGPKKYYVYTRNPKTRKIIKVNFGDSGNLSAKINNPKARKSFVARHDCKNKKDRTKPGYWSCRLPRYAKSLGIKGGGNFMW